MADTVSLTAVGEPVGHRDALRTGGEAVAYTTLTVDGMTCGGCMRRVEGALLEVPGVSSARVNLSNRRVAVTLAGDGRAPPVEKLLDALEAAGFRAAVLAPSGPPAGSSEGDLVRPLAVAGFAAMNIMLLSVAVWSGHGEMDRSLQTLMHWIAASIALPAVAYAGLPFFRSAAGALSRRRVNMDVPISLGVVLATAMSVYQTFRGSEQVYFDAAVTLLFFLLIGRALDLAVRRSAVSAAENLLALRSPTTTVVSETGRSMRIPTCEVGPGARILVAAGERAPVDACVTQGVTQFDEALVTGETRPRRIGPGDPIYAGTINLSAPIEATVTAREENTLLADIARLIETAQQARGRYVRLADRAARLYAPAVHVLGLATFAGWMVAGYGWEPALTAAIAVLIITCPCALALAVPAVQVAAVGRLFQQGILVKAADGLERLAEIDAVVFDKTGTLTLGEPRLVADASASDAAVSRAAGLAVASVHPYSRAIVRAARERGLSFERAPGIEEVAGAGLRSVSPAGETRLGSARFCGVAEAEGDRPTLYLSTGEGAPIAFRFEDPLRPDATDVVASLGRDGLSVELLSGDRDAVVEAAARATGIATWRAGRRPDQKVARLIELEQAGRKVLMIGDGLNDAPALARGHASISPSNAADVSQTTADVVFQGARLSAVLETLKVAKAARRLARQNFAIAIGYNVLFVPLAMLGVVTPLIAAVAMSASSTTVTANAARLRLRPKETQR